MDLLKRHQSFAIEKARKKIERWPLTRAKGKWRYLLRAVLLVGLVCGTITASFISLMENGFTFEKFVAGWPWKFWLGYLVMGSLLGLIFGWRQWNFYEGVYLKRQSDKQA